MSETTKLGQPLPNSPHAVSVSLPKWADVVGYEESDPRVINAMQLGYPRFVYHPLIKKLCAEAEKELASKGEFCLCLPSKKIANWCVDYCTNSTPLPEGGVGGGSIHKYKSIYAVILPISAQEKAKQFWQHSGFIISSRQAENILENRKPKTENRKDEIKNHLAQLSNADPDDIYLYPSGMAAIFASYYLLARTNPEQREGKRIERVKDRAPLERNNKTIQLGFPYVDTLKIQQRFGQHEYIDFDDYEKLSQTNSVGVFTEYPLNPNLDLVDFKAVRKAIGDTPLIVDDTLATWLNIQALDHADIAVTSLTKFYSGIGDVLAGCLILNKNSPHYANFKQALETEYEDLLYPDDAEILFKNGQNYEERIKKINENAKELTEFLKSSIINHQSSIKHFGGIISVIFENQEDAINFYDNLNVAKGPSLGTAYTLACPYTLLAHYNEQDWAASKGVSANLIRISVGTEDINELKEKFANSLTSI